MVAKSKTFDCVAMKYEIQDRIAHETRGMSTAEVMEYMRRGAEAFRAENARRPHDPKVTLTSLFEAFDREQEKRGNL